MSHPLDPRERCLAQLRARCAGDVHMLAFALLAATERLDLDQLNSLVAEVNQYDDESQAAAVRLIQQLLDERFGRN